MLQDKNKALLRPILAAYAGGMGGALLFALAFCAFFYAAQVLFIDGYAFEPQFFVPNVVFLGGLVLAFLLLPGPIWLYLTPAYLLLLVPTVLVSAYICIYKTPFNFNTFYFIWETNRAEAGEFLQESLRRFPLLPLWVGGCCILPLFAAFPLARSVRRAKARGFVPRLGLFVVALQCALWAGYPLGAKRYNYVAQCYRTGLEFKLDELSVRFLSQAAQAAVASEDICAALPDEVPETYVVVVGESANRHHWGAYGYSRDTTPFMSGRVASSDLFCFRNVCSTAIGTTLSLFRTLTFLDQGKKMSEYTYSFIDLFNRAGFSTWWLSNNAVLGEYDTMLEAFTKNSAHWRVRTPKDADVQGMQHNWLTGDAAVVNPREVTFDEYLFPWFDEALADPAPKKLIVLHLKGSHVIYRYRYPESFDVFQNAEGLNVEALAEKDPMAVKIVNAYDNSILYTDWILEQVILRLRRYGGRSWVLHFSDHGEDVFDHNDFNGRDRERVTKYMLDVPFVAWFSDEYRQQRDVSAFDGYLDRPFRLDDTIHVILDLAGLRTELWDPTRSLFSDRYQMRPRAVFEDFYLNYPPLDLVNRATFEQERRLDEELISGDADL